MINELFYRLGIFVPVRDLEKSADWYHKYLGFTIKGWDKPEAVLLCGEDEIVTFCLVRCEDFQPTSFPKNRYDVDVYYNFASKDVAGMHRRLSEGNVNVTQIKTFGDHHFFTFTDPDGNKFGVVNH